MKVYLFILLLVITTLSSCSNNQKQPIVKDTSAFVTTWLTTIENDCISIFTNPHITTGYNYTIDWGDGTTESNLTGDATHIYLKPGLHTVHIT